MAKKVNKYKHLETEVGPVNGLGKLFALARPVKLEHKPTRWAALLSVLAFCGAAAWKLTQGMDFYDAAMAGLGDGLVLFLCYMLGRELDPDRSWGGVIGGVLAVVWSLWAGDPNVLVVFLLLFVQRMLNRSSGAMHNILDNVLLLVCAFWLLHEGGWMYPMLLAAAYVVESQVPKGAYYSLYLAAIAMAMLFFGEIDTTAGVLSIPYIVLGAVAVILFLPMLRMSTLVLRREDRTGVRMDGARLRIANLFFLVAIFFIAFFQGDVQGRNLAPAMFTAGGVGAYLVYDLGRKRKAAR